jgi:hypothetical protein
MISSTVKREGNLKAFPLTFTELNFSDILHAFFSSLVTYVTNIDSFTLFSMVNFDCGNLISAFNFGRNNICASLIITEKFDNP